MPSIGVALRIIRRSAGKQLGEVARTAGVSVPLLSQIENGTRSPSTQTLRRLADALCVPFEALLAFEFPQDSSISLKPGAATRITGMVEDLMRIENSLRHELQENRREKNEAEIHNR